MRERPKSTGPISPASFSVSMRDPLRQSRREEGSIGACTGPDRIARSWRQEWVVNNGNTSSVACEYQRLKRESNGSISHLES